MKTYWHYSPFRPVHSPLYDSPARKPLTEVTVQGDKYLYKVALFTDDAGQLDFIRIEIPGLKDEALIDECRPMIQLLKEHMLSVLRIIYDTTTYYWSASVWNFTDSGDGPDMNVTISETTDRPQITSEGIQLVFKATLDYREELRLLYDADSEYIPLQYRYLSLYRILELHLSSKGKWRDAELDDLLRESNVSLIRKEVHTLRNKCAHIKITNAKSATGETFGVTHLNPDEAERVKAALPALHTVCTLLLNKLAKGVLELVPGTSRMRSNQE